MKAIHKKTGNIYKIVTDNFMFKKDGVWIKNLVLYEALYPNPDGKYFARTKEDFNEHFEIYDEKIREEIIKLVKFYYGSSLAQTHSVSKDDMIAWLEKQGELKQVSYFKADDWYVSEVDHKIHNIHQQGKTALEAINEEEKVDNANKVEQKFHEDDYIVNNISGDVFKVTEIKDDEYCLCPLDGEIVGCLRFIDVDNEYHLWTIEDAKPGDVLYLQHDGKKHIIIYKGVIKERFRTFISAYCAYNSIVDAFCFADVNRYADIAYGGIMPATKEQHEVLFYKMREAGYEWNKKKKELKKIEKQGEQKQTIRERYENIGKSEWFKRTHKGISVSVEVDKEPRWTEEDEIGSDETIELLEYFINYAPEFRRSAIRRSIYWIKSLKERMEE